MSLFRTKEWWRTNCGSCDEVFDGQSLLIADLFGPEWKDWIVVSSHSGYLRIYKPSSRWNDDANAATGYELTDLMIEIKLADCIIQAKAGRFVSGSQEKQLAVLTPEKLIIFKVTYFEGSTGQGDRCSLEAVYEHLLTKVPANLLVGAFGAVEGRDFFCIQSLDGTLLFYEQEIHTFTQILKDRLLPEQLAYVCRNDVFITSSPGWILECYRYQNMAEFKKVSDSSEGVKSLEPDWSYNIGESIVGIQTVTITSFEAGIIVLGEKNLYCFRDNCSSIKYAKKLEYNPVCFHAYVIEPDGKVMVLVVADTNTLLVYEGTTLKWSAQLPFTPVAIARAHFKELEGVTVILSDEGRLEVCYLGAEPSLFVAPPIHRRCFDYKEAEKKLVELRKIAKKSGSSSDRLSGATMKSELLMSVDLSKNFDESISKADEYAATNGGYSQNNITMNLKANLNIELSSYTCLQDVQLNLQVFEPFAISQNYFSFHKLRDRQIAQTNVFVKNDSTPISCELFLTASYEIDSDEIHVVQKIIQLPLRMMLCVCPPENLTSCSVTIKWPDPAFINFTQLFPEFIGESQQQTSNSLGLRYIHSGQVVTLFVSPGQYKVHSNDMLSLTLIIHQLIKRLQSKSIKGLATSVESSNLQLVQSHIESHFTARQHVKAILSEIALLTIQLRNIEKKLVRSIRERSSRSLTSTGLPLLLNSTYQSLNNKLDEMQLAHVEQEHAGHRLQCAVKLLLLLLQVNIPDDKYSLLESAIGFKPQLRNELDWEEVCDVTLGALLHVTSKKPELSVQQQLSWNKFETIRDLAKLKKRLVYAIERLSKPLDVVHEDESDL